MHATMVLVATLRFLLHEKNPNSTPRWSREVRIACRCAEAFLPLVLSSSEPGFDVQCTILIGTNMCFFLERYGRVNVEEVNEMVASRPKSTPSTIDHAFVVKAAFLCGLKATRLCSYIYIGRSCLEGWQSFGGIEDGWWHNLERLMVLMIMIMDTNMYIYINLSDQWSVSFRGRAEIPLFAC